MHAYNKHILNQTLEAFFNVSCLLFNSVFAAKFAYLFFNSLKYIKLAILASVAKFA